MPVTSIVLVPEEEPVTAAVTAGAPAPVIVQRRTAGEACEGRMLLLHGLANSGSVWDAYIEHGRRAGGPEVWTADLPWRGDGVATWSRRGDVVPHMADALGAVPGGAGVVVAHSMGANVLLEFLDRRLRQGVDPFAEFGIRALVLVSPFYRRTPEEFDWETLTSSIGGFDSLMAEGIRVHSGERLPEEDRHALGERVRDRVGPYGWLRFFETYLATPRLATGLFTVPCLVVAGEHDFAAPPEEGRRLAADLPDAEFRLLPDCGHFLMIEQAQRFAAVVGQFVSTSSAACPPSGTGLRASGEHDR
ncbi:alpha/beta hydrolase [Streptomyces sp. SCA3-4]|uniref:alpha/beta fold hydrolase n=1 Tax=Streptomyces sichuanensis TaxID=2871810 RepID=UPI001CE363C8|nr:alpha/beta hydrolase [Streptomyces sichuanensis]MCA6094682.1 alpha/beta hydrolase [Streptomyces sichuanensis]